MADNVDETLKWISEEYYGERVFIFYVVPHSMFVKI